MRFVFSILMLIAPLLSAAAGEPAAPNPIPESQISTLHDELTQEIRAAFSSETARQGGREGGIVGSRRAFKNLARKGQALLAETPTAPNRYRVLAIVLESQKRLLGLENSESNRADLFDTCVQLGKAPDEYAEYRLEADLILSEKDLAAKNATVEERAKALSELVARYRRTPAEAKSLLMAALIAKELDATELEDSIREALDENFADDPEVIAFRRKHFEASCLDVMFKGTFERIDGTTLSFPADALGHLCLMVFWSKNKTGFEGYLEKTAKLLAQFPGLIDVFSFNLDELPDGGKQVLLDKGLNWTVMRLPGGRNHQAYRAYAQFDPSSLLVNEYGFSVTYPELVAGQHSAVENDRVSDDRYTAQLQSLFIGDLLVETRPRSPCPPATPAERGQSSDGSPTTNVELATSPLDNAAASNAVPSIPEDTLDAIQNCFTMPPFRYRLTRKEALANYERAEKLCSDAAKRYANASNLWLVRNRRIVALMGMWNLACEPRHLQEAAREAELTLKTTLPPGADVVPKSCLVKKALRDGNGDPEETISRFWKETGGTNAPASALAAAAILSLNASLRELHDRYRGMFLDSYGANPEFYWFSSFLRDRHHRYRLLKPNCNNNESRARSHIVDLGSKTMTNLLPRIELKTLDGGALVLPNVASDKLTLLVFLEPPTDQTTNSPGTSGTGPMQFAHELWTLNTTKTVDLVAAFLCDDTNRVNWFMQTNAWTCRAAIVPGGLKNPLAGQLGILSADRLANVFLLRRDGTVAWKASGLPYKDEFGFPFAFLLAIKVHIEVCDTEFAYAALKKGDFKTAAHVFSGPFPPANPDRYGWRSPRYHGLALAHMGLKDWQAALDDIDTAIDAHKFDSHFRGQGPAEKDWRTAAITVTVKQPCNILAMLWKTKAVILDRLGQKEKAEEERKRAAGPIESESSDIYSRFHEKLEAFKSTMERTQ